MELEYKSLPVRDYEVKADRKGMTISGYAAIFGNVDEVGDIIQKGAFAKTIAERFPKGKIKMLWDHWEPFGMPTALEEDGIGLRFDGKVSKTSENEDRMVYVEDKVFDAMSIGYLVPDGKSIWNDDFTVRTITEVKLFEISAVMFPANELAAITSVQKHMEANLLLKSLGRDELLKKARDLKGIDEDKVDAAIASLTELKNAIALPAEAKPEPTHKGITPPDSLGEPHGSPSEAGLEDELDPEAAAELQSFVEELKVENEILAFGRNI